MQGSDDLTFDREVYDRRAAQWRYVITDMICRAGSGHIGGALSLVEVVMTLYYRVMNIRPEQPRWEDRDRLICSKGHAGPVIYLALAARGYFPESWLGTLNADGTRLPSHCDQNQTPGIDVTTGSLGQGLSCACGVALAARMDGRTHRVFCIVGDGECNEGQIWEAAMFAGHNRLDNLMAVMDYNKLQIDGFTRDVMDLEPLEDKWRAFGWDVASVDGHDWDALYEVFNAMSARTGKPKMVIAHTIKGKGCAPVENRPESHNIKVPDAASYQKYLDAVAFEGAKLPY